MKRGNISKLKANRVSLEPILFMFPPINQHQLKKSFVIKTQKQQKTVTITKTSEPSKLRKIPLIQIQQPTTHNMSNNSQIQNPRLLQPNTIIQQSLHAIKNKPDLHEIEHSIGGTSVYQFSEIDKSDMIMGNIELVISQKGSILSIINDIGLADVLELKSIYSQLVIPLVQELSITPKTTQWFKGFALFVSILEESLFRHEIIVDQSLDLIEGVSSKYIVDIFSNFIYRMGQQIQFIREEKFDSFLSMLNQIMLYILPINDIEEDNIERIIKGCNQCFRINSVREKLKYLTRKTDGIGLGRCGIVLVYTLCRFSRIQIPLCEFEGQFKSPYLIYVESQLRNNFS